MIIDPVGQNERLDDAVKLGYLVKLCFWFQVIHYFLYDSMNLFGLARLKLKLFKCWICLLTSRNTFQWRIR